MDYIYCVAVKKEQELFNSNKPVSLLESVGTKSMNIFPGRVPHVIRGTDGSLVLP